jgi:hypothetical protein
MIEVDIWALQLFSASGGDTRFFYTTIDSNKYIEYIGISPSINAPTSDKVWFIGKLYYDAEANVTRFVKLSTQQILDNRTSLFPV